MMPPYKNSEYYTDWTAYKAIQNIERKSTMLISSVKNPLPGQVYETTSTNGNTFTVLVLAAVLYAAVFGLTDTFVSWFNSENSLQMAQYAHTGMRMYFVGYFFAGFNIMAAGGFHHLHLPGHGSHRGLLAGAQRGVRDAGCMGGLPGLGTAHRAADPVFAAQKKG